MWEVGGPGAECGGAGEGGHNTLSSLCGHQRARTPVQVAGLHRRAGAHPEGADPPGGAQRRSSPFANRTPAPEGTPRSFWNPVVLDLAGPGQGGCAAPRPCFGAIESKSPALAFMGRTRPGPLEAPRSAPSVRAPPRSARGPTRLPGGGAGRGPGARRSPRRVTAPAGPAPGPPPAPGRLLLMARARGPRRALGRPGAADERASMSGTRASNDRPPGAGGVKRGRLQQEAAATGSRVTVVLGAQWGDEGKGKVVDLLATDADIISRCQVRARAPGPPPPSTQTDPVPALPRPDPDMPLGYLPSWGHLSQGPPPPTHTRTHHPRTQPPCHSDPHTLPSRHLTPLAHSLPQGPPSPPSPTLQGCGPAAEL